MAQSEITRALKCTGDCGGAVGHRPKKEITAMGNSKSEEEEEEEEEEGHAPRNKMEGQIYARVALKLTARAECVCSCGDASAGTFKYY